MSHALSFDVRLSPSPAQRGWALLGAVAAWLFLREFTLNGGTAFGTKPMLGGGVGFFVYLAWYMSLRVLVAMAGVTWQKVTGKTIR